MKVLIRAGICVGILLLLSGCGGSNSNLNYVAIGASDAVGIGAEPLDKGYVFQIDDRLATVTDGVDLTNLGIPGAETDEFVDVSLPIAKESNPDLVTIFAGPNDLIDGDSTDDFRNRLDTLLRELKESTQPFIAIATIPDLTRLPRFMEKPDSDVTGARIAAYNQIIREKASQYGASIVDLTAFTPNSTLVSDEDGFHPSNEGHTLIADLFLRVIEPVFRTK